MVIRLLPDVEALTVEYLRADSSLQAIVGNRISTQLGSAFPTVTILLVTGTELIRTHFDEYHLQVDSWADDKTTASLLARTVRAVMLEAPAEFHNRGVVSGVRTITLPRWFPDDTVNPPRPRYLAEFGVAVHPHPV